MSEPAGRFAYAEKDYAATKQAPVSYSAPAARLCDSQFVREGAVAGPGGGTGGADNPRASPSRNTADAFP